MLYIYKKNLRLVKNKLLYYVIYLILISIYLLMHNRSIQYFGIDKIKCLIGLGVIDNYTIIQNLFILFSYMFLLYFTINLYIIGIIENLQYIMLRMKKINFIFFHYIMIYAIILCLKLILGVGIACIFFVFDTTISIFLFFKLILYDIVFSLLIVSLYILLINLIPHKYFNWIFIPLIIGLIFYTMIIDICSIRLIYIIIAVIILFIINMITFSPSKINNKFYYTIEHKGL